MASELKRAKKLTELQLKAAVDDASSWGGVDWYVCPTSLSELTDNFNNNYDGNTPVCFYSVPVHTFNVKANEWTGFQFDTPFDYDGVSNLIFETRVKSAPTNSNISFGCKRVANNKVIIEGPYNSQSGSYSPFVQAYRLYYDATESTEEPFVIINKFTLSNYPNPFNSVTAIKYHLLNTSHVILTIYDQTGKAVKTPINELQSAGWKTSSWNGRNQFNEVVGAGIYIYRLQSGNTIVSRKMQLIR